MSDLIQNLAITNITQILIILSLFFALFFIFISFYILYTPMRDYAKQHHFPKHLVFIPISFMTKYITYFFYVLINNTTQVN